MNRENKRKAFEKGYYKTHTCSDTFICKVCGRTVVPENAGSGHRNHCPNCYRACTWTLSRATAKATAAASWTPSGCGCGKKRSGR